MWHRLTLFCLCLPLLLVVPDAEAGKRSETSFDLKLSSPYSENYGWQGGKWRAAGAIRGRGAIDTFWVPGQGSLRTHYGLEGKDGGLKVIIWPDAFYEMPIEEGDYELSGTGTVQGISGTYAGLEGSGTATGTLQVRRGKHEWVATVQWHFTGDLNP